MSRQRALVLAIVLATIAALQFTTLPVRLAVPGAAALSQDASQPQAGQSTDLAVVALHCAEAPAADALTAYFSTGAPPAGCAPAVGVAVGVTVDDAALAGSPFQTDVAGSLVVPVGLGSAVAVKEDPKSLPAGYVPLDVEANGVPYANPVRLDAAVEGAAVLFVNVPTAVGASLAQAAATPANQPASGQTASNSAPAATGCDPVQSAQPTATSPAPASRALTAAGRGAGSNRGARPGAATTNGASTAPLASSTRRAAPAGYGNAAIASSPDRVDTGSRSWLGGNRGDTWPAHTDRAQPGLWRWPSGFGVSNLTAARSGSGDLALVSSDVRFDRGVFFWPSTTDGSHGWPWHADRDRGNDWQVRGNGLWVSSVVLATSGNGNLAFSGSSVRVGASLWFWPPDRNWGNAWFFHTNDGWRWPGRAGVGNLTLARSGNGTLALVSSTIRFDRGAFFLPQGLVNHGFWSRPGQIGISNLTLARSSSGNLAVVSNAVLLNTGVWLLPPDRGHANDWLMRGTAPRNDRSSAEPLTVNGSLAVETSTTTLAQPSASEQPATTSSDGFAAEPAPADDAQPAADAAAPSAAPAQPVDGAEPAVDAAQAPASAGQAPADAGQPPSDGAQPVADAAQAPVKAEQPAAGGDGAAPADDVAAPAVDAAPTAAPVDAGVDAVAVDSTAPPAVESYPDASQAAANTAVQPAAGAGPADAAYAAPDAGYAEPSAPPAIEPSSSEPAPGPGVDTTSVEPAPSANQPDFGAGNDGAAAFAAPGGNEPAVAPVADTGYVDLAPDPGAGVPGFDNSGGFAPNTGGDPGFANPGNAAPDAGFGGPASSAGGAPDLGNAGPASAAPDGGNGGPGFDGPGGETSSPGNAGGNGLGDTEPDLGG